MLGTLSKTAVVATTALIIGLAPIATADLAFARGGGGGGIHMGGGGGGHFGGGQFGGGHFGGGFAGRAFREGGFHRHFGRFGGGAYYAYCGGPYSYPYPPYSPYGYTSCY